MTAIKSNKITILTEPLPTVKSDSLLSRLSHYLILGMVEICSETPSSLHIKPTSLHRSWGKNPISHLYHCTFLYSTVSIILWTLTRPITDLYHAFVEFFVDFHHFHFSMQYDRYWFNFDVPLAFMNWIFSLPQQHTSADTVTPRYDDDM